ncbi:MAG: UDP-2,3-diacylglucosamine diphosphatase [Hylemonella sp.]|uniref:UDP-2,3-diacylglucosamine diphosphatase n=1 Tax=Hylemonella sp. TaxID=2066020 RepID=UPI0022C180A4|nr:UDP-2,3-diacylglucosamine diphosphatase [Hylemonella sp.]MCZ8251905.1 UDP-2,3-diacylglucosamine diphosphatase [Hylemonella sp.]
MTSTTPRYAELHAPAHWRVVDFISDLHLQASEPQTVQAWKDYLRQTRADAVFLLGDIFEVWVGDDGLDGDDEDARFERACIDMLSSAGERRPLHLMHGNRDFLLGPEAARRARCTLLDDPTVLIFGNRRWLLSHGDALCIDDHEYLAFRAQVRTPRWQQAFLAQPLAQRRQIARGLRQQSEERKRSGVDYADVDASLARQWLQQAQATELIHGHTHKPADHALGAGLHRRVLSDWDLQAVPPRAEVLRLQDTGHDVSVQRLPLDQAR